MAAFFFFSALYFVLHGLQTAGYYKLDQKVDVVIKCLPIICLILSVRSKFSTMKDLKKNSHAFWVLIALCFSVVADAALVFGKDTRFFLAGLGLFMLAIICYLQAFGWKKLKLYILPIPCAVLTSMYYYIFVMASEVPFQIMIGCLVYSLIGQVAIWRAWARVDWKDVKKGDTKDLLAAIGVISFATSDFSLAINKFSFPLPHNTYVIMSTYYFAQYAISSAVRNKKNKKK